MQDAARQLAYGMQHLKYFLSKHDERRKEIHNFLNKAEAVFMLRRGEGHAVPRGADHPAGRRDIERSR